MSDLRHERQNYSGDRLPDVMAEPWTLFDSWFAQARAEQQAGRLPEANAMILATCAPEEHDGLATPSARTVLLKEYDHQGLVWYTNYDSVKGRQLSANPVAAVLFWWPSVNRQVRITGPVAQVSRAQSEEYFAVRPRASQLAALASHQSHPRASRDELEASYALLELEYQDQPVPCPPSWGGYRLTPIRFEFWQGQADRLHDRVELTRVDSQEPGHDAWTSTRLDP